MAGEAVPCSLYLERLAVARSPLKPSNPAPAQVYAERGAVSAVQVSGPAELLPVRPVPGLQCTGVFLVVFKEKMVLHGNCTASAIPVRH